MHISQGFDAGNIELISCAEASNIQLRIREDADSEFYQWFYFRLSGVKATPCTLHILNAGGAAYPLGFENYRVCYSYDRQQWLRHPSSLKNGKLTIDFRAEHDSVYFAYFAPYSMERHADLVAKAQLSPRCSHSVVTKTLDGQDIDLLKFSLGENEQPKKKCWIIARQHPGESMAEWWMEGCIERLLDEPDSGISKLLGQCDLYLVPNMNPDGSRRGHLRTNAVGRNLNREWADPKIDVSPEVYFVKQAINETGADFMLDVHGDESLPYCFIAGTEGLADWNASKQANLDFYTNKLAELNPDFQTKEGYPAKTPGTANLGRRAAQIAATHGCLGMTLEMPFKDTTATPDATYGWSGERSKRLAHSCLDALSAYLERL